MSVLTKSSVPTERVVQMACGIVRRLKEKELEIREIIDVCASAPVELCFQPSDCFIMIKGLQDDIDLAEDILIAHATAESSDPGRRKEEMLTEDSKSLERPHQPIVAVPISIYHHQQPQQSSPELTPSDIRRPYIKVVSGSITEFKADVLVNTIGNKSLERGGVVLGQFLKAGFPNMEQELRKSKIPEVFGKDVIVTRAFGSIDAKFVLHAAIEKYQEKSSLDKLYNTIKICLQMAVDRNATKIAFPTLGCGRLAFKPEDVVECFLRAQRDTKKNLKIRIVAHDENLLKQFRQLLRHEIKRIPKEVTETKHQHSPTGATSIKIVSGNITSFKADVLVNTIGNKNLERGGVVLGQFLKAGFPNMEQELRKSKIPEVFGRDVIVTRASGSIDAKFVLHAAIEKYQEKSSLDKLYETIKICLQMAMNKNATSIAFPTLGCGNLAFEPEDVVRCFVRAERDSKSNLKIFIIAFVEDLRKQFETLLNGLTCLESTQNQREHLARISGADCYPVYWTAHRSSSEATFRYQQLLDPSSAWYDEVSQMVMKTWNQQKVGQGFDAKGLGNHAIKITGIYCNENPLLMDQYMNLRNTMSKSAMQHHQLADQNNEAEISTMALGPMKLYETLNHQLNEVFLFHGTKSDAVTKIGTQGIDTRLCGEKPLFGHGSYFTESSTKADQYADLKEQRASLGQTLHMYLCRVLLGSTYVCSDPKNIEGFKRPPCMENGCHSERCSHTELYDSVVGTHRPDPQTNGRLHFREFVVYRLDQSYPDFLIEYQRVAYP